MNDALEQREDSAMRQICTFLLASVVGLFALNFAQSAGAGDMKLKLGNEGSYPPFSILGTDGELSGMEPDLAWAVCERMGADCEIVAMDFKALLPSLIAGKIDMIASQLTPKPERLEKTEFTRAVLYAPDGFVVPNTWDKGYDEAAMSSVKVGVQRGSSHADYLRLNWSDAEPVYYENPDQMQLDLVNGRINAVFGQKLIWAANLIDKPEGSDWKLSEVDFWVGGEGEGLHWAVQKGQTDLAEKINEAIVSLVEDCTYTEIRKKYLSVQTMPDEPANCL